MHYVKLIVKNVFRHKLRSLLTIIGLVVAILAFGLLRTVVHAWYAGADMASAQRLITRNATSLVFALPAYYRERIRAIDGVNKVVISNWFGGIYKDAAHDRRPGKHPGMHRTETVDYAIVLEGEIWAVMDEGETLMRAGDVLIQRGTNHAWANRSNATARIAFVLIDGNSGTEP